MAFFIGIACPWILVAIMNRLAETRRLEELASLGVSPAPATANSSYLVPDRPY